MFKKENFVEVKPFNHPESESPGIVIKPIEKDFGWGTIEGYHLLSPAIAKEPERQGDGWVCEELPDGRLFAAVIDVSLSGEESFSGGVGKKEPITEKQILLDLKLFLGEYLKVRDLARLMSVDILKNNVMSFEPDYLKAWKGQLLWGFSLAVGLFDPKRNIADLANLGTNILTQEKSQGQFRAVISSNRRFYTSSHFTPKQKYGGKIPPQTRVLPFQRKILFATDGIRTKKPFLKSPEVILKGDPSNLLVAGQKAEGLYIVIKRKVI